MKTFVLFLAVALYGAGCSPGGSSDSPRDGGGGGARPSGTGGVSGTGGATTGTGGANTGTGGANAASGGATGSGGATTGSGGMDGGGGRSSTGGASGAGGRGTDAGGATAGASGRGPGGAGATGGMAATGGRGGGAAGANGSGGAAGANGSGGAAPGTGGMIGSTAGPPETKPLGYGRNTTGGGSASPVNADSFAALQAAIDGHSTGGLVVTYTGRFNFASITDPCAQFTKEAQTIEIKQKSNITIQGADGSAANFGLHIASSSSNIIVRNMTFGLLPGGDASDAISVEGMSSGFPTDIWIDHNELFSSLTDCAGAGDSSFDGLLDFKKGADRVTVSYNYLHDHHKVSLNGFSDSDDAVRHITFHHNVFENVGARTPLQRAGFSHLLNNVFHGVTTSAINVRMGGYSLVEANYFDTVKNAVTSRDSAALGFWELRNNNVKGPTDFPIYGLTWSPSSDQPTKDATDWTTTAAFPESLGYSYTADPAGCLKDDLLRYAGAGKKLATLKCP